MSQWIEKDEFEYVLKKEEFQKVDKRYGVVVLDDGETYSSALENIGVVYLTEEGFEEAGDDTKIFKLPDDMVAMSFSVQELIDFWNANHGWEELQ